MRNKLVRIEIMATVVFKCDCCGHTNKQDVKVHCKSWGEPMDDEHITNQDGDVRFSRKAPTGEKRNETKEETIHKTVLKFEPDHYTNSISFIASLRDTDTDHTVETVEGDIIIKF